MCLFSAEKFLIEITLTSVIDEHNVCVCCSGLGTLCLQDGGTGCGSMRLLLLSSITTLLISWNEKDAM